MSHRQGTTHHAYRITHAHHSGGEERKYGSMEVQKYRSTEVQKCSQTHHEWVGPAVIALQFFKLHTPQLRQASTPLLRRHSSHNHAIRTCKLTRIVSPSARQYIYICIYLSLAAANGVRINSTRKNLLGWSEDAHATAGMFLGNAGQHVDGVLRCRAKHTPGLRPQTSRRSRQAPARHVFSLSVLRSRRHSPITLAARDDALCLEVK